MKIENFSAKTIILFRISRQNKFFINNVLADDEMKVVTRQNPTITRGGGMYSDH